MALQANAGVEAKGADDKAPEVEKSGAGSADDSEDDSSDDAKSGNDAGEGDDGGAGEEAPSDQQVAQDVNDVDKQGTAVPAEDGEDKVKYQPLEEVRDQIRRQLATEKAVEQLKTTVDRLFTQLRTVYNPYGEQVRHCRGPG